MKPYYADECVQIYHGDCFDVLHDLEGCGAVVTDPPYSSGGAFRGDRARGTVDKYVNSEVYAYRPEFAGDNRDQRAFVAWAAMWLNAARRACTVGAPLLTFIDWRQLPSMTDAVQAGGWMWRGLAVWHKPGIRMQRGRFSASAEFIVYGTHGEAIEHEGYAQNVFACPPIGDKEHIAQKPEAVLHWALQVVPAGARVLDPFMGSGTTLVAARLRGSPAIGIEVDERYCEIAARRLSQGTLVSLFA